MDALQVIDRAGVTIAGVLDATLSWMKRVTGLWRLDAAAHRPVHVRHQYVATLSRANTPQR